MKGVLAPDSDFETTLCLCGGMMSSTHSECGRRLGSLRKIFVVIKICHVICQRDAVRLMSHFQVKGGLMFWISFL